MGVWGGGGGIHTHTPVLVDGSGTHCGGILDELCDASGCSSTPRAEGHIRNTFNVGRRGVCRKCGSNQLFNCDSPMEIAGVDLKYQEENSTKSPEWLTLSLRYKEPTGTDSKLISHIVDATHFTDTLSDNLKLAASVAEYGMLLRDSEHRGDGGYDAVLNRLDSMDTLSDDAYIDEFYNLVKIAKSLD